MEPGRSGVSETQHPEPVQEQAWQDLQSSESPGRQKPPIRTVWPSGKMQSRMARTILMGGKAYLGFLASASFLWCALGSFLNDFKQDLQQSLNSCPSWTNT